jgi:DNA-binding SARP family transcriptional activator
MELRIQLLGPVLAWYGMRELDVRGPQRRAVLAMLASARQEVSRAELADGLWGPDPPASARNSVHVHISALRKVLEPRRAPHAQGKVLMAVGPGYRLVTGSVDTHVLDGHLADARLLAHADPAAAVRSLDAGLALWQGASLDGIPGTWAQIERARLYEVRQVATEDRVDLMLMLGAHHELLPDLAALIRQHPLRERFRGQLMLALYRCGRQAEALAAFDDARRELAAQIGIDPGPALRRIHARILAADPSLWPPRLGTRAAWRTSDLGWACSR